MSTFELRPVIGVLGDHVKLLANPGDPDPSHPPTTVDLGLYVDSMGHLLALTPEQVRHRSLITGSPDPIPSSQSPVNQPHNFPPGPTGPTGPTGPPEPGPKGANGPGPPKPQEQLAFSLSDYQQGRT